MKLKFCLLAISVLFLLAVNTRAQTDPVLVTNAPAFGTFFYLHQDPSPPFPFDPSFGMFPIWSLGGTYYIDEGAEGSRGFQTLGSSKPPGLDDTNSVPTNTYTWSTNICAGPTNFTIRFQHDATATNAWLGLSVTTNNVADLRIYIADTNALIDVYCTTNLSPSVPPWNLTNWFWLRRASNETVSFTLTNLNGCQIWFQTGSLLDDDGDTLTTAFERLVSKTDPYNSDSDYDGRSDPQELVDGTDPNSPASVLPTRLAYFPFNDTNWLGSAGQAPLTSTNLALSDAWLTKAVQLDATNKALLKYRDTETNLNPNINLRNGAVRFWFRPDWTSGGTNGPKAPGRLMEVGTEGSSGGGTNGWWALYFNTNATQITFSVQTNNLGTNCLTAGFTNDCSKNWHQFVLNYSSSNTALYLDGTLLTNGNGLPYWPGPAVRTNGFTIGSDGNGTNQAKGSFEDLETFNYPLSTNEIAENFQTNLAPNAIANLKMWLKADAGVTTNTPPYISSWLDQTCNGINVQQITVQNRALLSSNEVNGLPAIRFFGTNYFTFPNFPTNWTEAEVFVILKTEEDYPSVNRGLWALRGNNGAVQYYPKTDGTIDDDFGRGSSPNDNLNPSASLTNPHLYNVVTKSSEWTSRINGVIHYSNPTNVVEWPNSAQYLGQNPQGNPFKGFIAEMLIYNRALNEFERHALEAYLNQRYWLVTNAPPMPSNLVAQAASPTQLSVSWDARLSNTNVTFLLERKTSGGSFITVTNLRNGASFLDSGLQTNIAYTYRVRAENFAGRSGYSAEASSTTSSNGADIPLSALKLWLKADCGRGGSPVPFWMDQSGTRNHAEQELSSSDRRLIAVENGIATNKPVIGFFTTNFCFLHNHASTVWTQAEAFAVMRARIYSPPTQREQWYFGSNLAEYPAPTNSAATNAIFDNFFDDSATHPSGAPLVNLTNFHLYNPQATSNSWNSRLNGASYFSTNAGVFTVHQNPRIGAGGNTKPWDGDMAEFMIFNRALSSDERTAVENYFNRRYFLW